jgi:hypothetical protein
MELYSLTFRVLQAHSEVIEAHPEVKKRLTPIQVEDPYSEFFLCTIHPHLYNFPLIYNRKRIQ